MALILLALVLVPVIEIALFIQIGGAIGTWATIGTIILTALIGAFLLQAQGGGLIARARAALGRGEMPVEAVVHGVFLLVAGVLLLTPGFFTDALGFLLCIPQLRLLLGKSILRRLRQRIDVHVTRLREEPRDVGPGNGPPGDDEDRAPPQDTPGLDRAAGPTKWRPPGEPPERRGD